MDRTAGALVLVALLFLAHPPARGVPRSSRVPGRLPVSRHPLLARLLSEIVAAVGPVTVFSERRGYNPRRPGSRHHVGLAADIKSATIPPRALHSRILAAYHAGAVPSLGGLGAYDSHVHVDADRVGRRLRRWDGGGP